MGTGTVLFSKLLFDLKLQVKLQCSPIDIFCNAEVWVTILAYIYVISRAR